MYYAFVKTHRTLKHEDLALISENMLENQLDGWRSAVKYVDCNRESN